MCYSLFPCCSASPMRKAGPSVCPLAQVQNEDPSAIKERIDDFYAQLYFEPLSIPDATRPGVLTQGRAICK